MSFPPSSPVAPRIAIIGAGIAGLTLARELSQRQFRVTVFEKARGVGGRMSTRYADPWFFDHGAMFFTARSEAFQQFLAPFQQQGKVQEWVGTVLTLEAGKESFKRPWFEPHFVATPGMNGLCKALAESLTENAEILCGVEVAPLSARTEAGWQLADSNGNPLGEFDLVISTAPAAQVQRLFPQDFCGQESLTKVKMTGCYTLMIGLENSAILPWPTGTIAAKINASPLEWIILNHSKPERAKERTTLVVHSTNEWAEAHIDEDIPAMQALLLEELARVTGMELPHPAYLTTHRWRYANVAEPAGETFLYDAALQLAACGDWCLGGRVEAAWQSAQALAQCLASKSFTK
jgi:predicted NAD/FAD-dependent oxidoreductase